MNTKQWTLEDKVKIAYLRATGRVDGWDVFISMVFKDTQEDIARAFKVSSRTSARWHLEFNQRSRHV